MKAFQLASGGEKFSIREYPIATSTNIKAGTLVKISAGKVVQCVAAETAAILGIAAETHSGSADALNPRSNGKVIKVIDSPELIMKCKGIAFEATGGSATTVTTDDFGAYSNDDWNGGFLILVEKAAGSTNTDVIGAVKEITDYAYNGTGTVSTFTVASGGTAVSGDKYLAFPPIGLAKFNLSSTFDGVVASAVNSTVLKAVGYDLEEQTIKLEAMKHFLGNNQ